MFEHLIVHIPPPTTAIHQGTVMFVPDRDGWIRAGRSGLFAYDTRYLSTYEITFEGLRLRLLTAVRPAYTCATLTFTNPHFRANRVDVPELSLIVTIHRCIDVEFFEAIEITSYASSPINFLLLINLECTFEDIFEVRDLRAAPPRIFHSYFDSRSRTVTYEYRDQPFYRRFDYQIVSETPQLRYSPNLITIPVHLSPRETWRLYSVSAMTGSIPPGASRKIYGGEGVETVSSVLGRCTLSTFAEREQVVESEVSEWLRGLPAIMTPNRTVQIAYDRSLRDLASLRLVQTNNQWFPAAGVPWYNTVFGRDSLVTAFQTLHLGCPFPRAVLAVLADLQGTRVDLRSDEEPGKIPHELRVGEQTATGKIPFNPFYGTVDASLWYVILLWEAYQFDGDGNSLREFVPCAARCIQWAAEFGDIDGDGFIEYWMRSPSDYHNQGWKDAGDAILYPDGQIVPDPIAVVEVQGYYYAALRALAGMWRKLNEPKRAAPLEARAEALRRSFNVHYWMPDRCNYALGLDPDKRQIPTVESNPGHLLWTGIVPVDRAAHVVARLLATDMVCGWGVRTLSSDTGGFNPVTYQRGSVWPHDNSLIALGMKRLGFWREANQIAEGIFSASSYFARGQLPELWAGLDRRETTWCVAYPYANTPQAWAAGSVALLLRSMLGIEPDVEHGRLVVSPTLPSWLDEITIYRLPILGGSADLRFFGQGTDSRVHVLRADGDVSFVRANGQAEDQ